MLLEECYDYEPNKGSGAGNWDRAGRECVHDLSAVHEHKFSPYGYEYMHCERHMNIELRARTHFAGEVDLNELAEAAAIVVAQRLRVAERLQQRVRCEHMGTRCEQTLDMVDNGGTMD